MAPRSTRQTKQKDEDEEERKDDVETHEGTEEDRDVKEEEWAEGEGEQLEEEEEEEEMMEGDSHPPDWEWCPAESPALCPAPRWLSECCTKAHSVRVRTALKHTSNTLGQYIHTEIPSVRLHIQAHSCPFCQRVTHPFCKCSAKIQLVLSSVCFYAREKLDRVYCLISQSVELLSGYPQSCEKCILLFSGTLSCLFTATPSFTLSTCSTYLSQTQTLELGIAQMLNSLVIWIKDHKLLSGPETYPISPVVLLRSLLLILFPSVHTNKPSVSIFTIPFCPYWYSLSVNNHYSLLSTLITVLSVCTASHLPILIQPFCQHVLFPSVHSNTALLSTCTVPFCPYGYSPSINMYCSFLSILIQSFCQHVFFPSIHSHTALLSEYIQPFCHNKTTNRRVKAYT